MIYITGDTHGVPEYFAAFVRYGEPSWTEDDVLIICGDFGYLFSDSEREHEFLDRLSEKPYTICFCDGNHENFKAICRYPVEFWNGGKIHRIRKNIIHLMRGQVFSIDQKKFFVMGGAYSIDRCIRIKDRSYWDEELPNNSEYREASASLKENGYKVDYIISHTAPSEIIRRMGYYPDPHDAELTGFFDWVMHETEFKKWFFGHWHEDRNVTDKFRAVYTEIETIE